MEQPEESSFRTKSGRCVVTTETITIRREGLTGSLTKGIYGNTINQAMILTGTLAVVLVGIGVMEMIDENYFAGLLTMLLGVYIGIGIFRSRDNSTAPTIQRAAVRSVEISPPIFLLSRGYFIINFDDNGQLRRRIIMLPGSLSGGGREYQKALDILRLKGWLPDK